MSKKKAFSGNTMTLKDFHGGSIPTDLPLPSAPGVMVRPLDRTGYDRATSWGNSAGRQDHRTRPSSSPSTRQFDDKTPFLTQTIHMGRNFDEDERKPLDGISAPRRTFSDESFHVQPARPEFKQDSTSGWPARASSVSQSSSGMVNSYSVRAVEQTLVGVKSPSPGGISRPNSGPVVHGSHPNAWMARKEVAVERMRSGLSGESVVSKLAHASALEKVSSGRWQSKQSHQCHTDEVADGGSHLNGYTNNGSNRVDMLVQRDYREYSDAALSSQLERGLNIEDVEVKEKKPTSMDKVQLTRSDGKHGCAESQSLMRSEASERPKLKLLPRTKPLESLESHVDDPKQGYYRTSVSANGRIGIANDRHGNGNSAKHDLAGSIIGNHAVERPKLNLKPLMEPSEKLEENVERERISVFGGARPRELVLRERGVEKPIINNQDLGPHSDRVKHDIHKTDRVDRVHEQGVPKRQIERTEITPFDQRAGRKFEKKDQRVDVERADMQRRNWRNENRRNGRSAEKQQQQERHPSPETWRKPVEQSKPIAVDGCGPRYGKAASALELAQAFSRSFSDPKLGDRYSGQRGLAAGRTQMPFSRLTGPSPRPQINGY